MNTKRNPVGWFEIYVQDTQRAKRFYENTFRVTLQRIEGTELVMWGFPMESEGSGCTGALVKMEGKDSGIGGTVVYFVCDDCAEECARAVAHGGQVQRTKMAIGQYGFIALVLDSEGNMIGLHSMK